MDKKKLLALFVFVVILVVLIVIFRNDGGPGGGSDDAADVVPVEADPVDTVMDFYSLWLGAIKDKDANPYTNGLLEKPILSEALRDKLIAAQSDFEGALHDPILCTTVTPEKLRTKIISHEPVAAQILMLEGGDNARALAVVKLTGVDGEWQMSDVDCNAGEVPPEQGEYTFEQTGFLLGPSVKPPLDSNEWYVVYEKDGLKGFTAVLNFNENSSCTDEGGGAIACGDEQLRETMEVSVQGDMQETGVDVVNLKIIDDQN